MHTTVTEQTLPSSDFGSSHRVVSCGQLQGKPSSSMSRSAGRVFPFAAWVFFKVDPVVDSTPM